MATLQSANRLEQKRNLAHKLGALFGPLYHLVERPDQYNSQERAQTIARYLYEAPLLGREFQAFTEGEPYHSYRAEYYRFNLALSQIEGDIAYRNTPLQEVLQTNVPVLQAAIDTIPIPNDSVILEAGTPFTAYCKLKDLCE